MKGTHKALGEFSTLLGNWAAADGALQPAVSSVTSSGRSLVIVARDQPALYEYLTRQFAKNAKVAVVQDRRRDERPGHATADVDRRARAGFDRDLRFHWVVVASARDAEVIDARLASEPQRDRCTSETAAACMTDGEIVVDDRERVERWIDEAERALDGVDDPDRLKHKIAAAETEIERLRAEVVGLRCQVDELRRERESLHGAQAAVADAFARAMAQLTEVQRPIAEALERLRPAQGTSVFNDSV